MKVFIRLLILGLWGTTAASVTAQSSLLTPQAYFNVPAIPGEFTLHHEAVRYIEYIARQSEECQLQEYGVTPERRPLMVAFVSTAENLSRLDYYQEQQQIRAGLLQGDTLPTKPIVWLSYNVHGDEAAGTEAALATLHYLVSSPEAQRWLEEVIIVIDPCENPDGHDRYVSHYRQRATALPNIAAHAAEHHQPWPGGRYNHYLFDLNRDWVWGTQPETKARIPLYQRYMPHVHVDVHEMGAESPYFFAPAALPFHEAITSWQRHFQEYVGQNNAHHFDQNGWLYYTGEIYDLLYPSYGDTWPTFNGAIGFTYEQGGSGKAGRALQLQNGSTLTLYDRTQHHFTASIATVETAYRHRHALVDALYRYFHTPIQDQYNTYVLKAAPHTPALLKLLQQQNIRFGHPKSVGQTLTAYNYNTQQRQTITLAPDDVLVPLDQPLSRLVKVLLEPHTYVQDSLTYDLTAWALPYVYQVPAWATEANLPFVDAPMRPAPTCPAIPDRQPYAAILTYSSASDAQALARLLDYGLQARLAPASFRIEGQSYPQGSILITRADNSQRFVRFDEAIHQALDGTPAHIRWVNTGLTEQGSNLGSELYRLIQPAKIAVLYGEGTDPLSYGEVWSFLEQDLQYPFTPILIETLPTTDLRAFDVLIAPSGQYALPAVLDFAQRGGTVIALDQAAIQLASSPHTQVRPQTAQGYTTSPSTPYGARERHALSQRTAGAIYKAHLDSTHPLAFGLGDFTYVMKRNHIALTARAAQVWQTGRYADGAHWSGFVGAGLEHHFDETIAFADEEYGQGHLVYFPDSPIFRGFWHSGKVLMANAIFLVR